MTKTFSLSSCAAETNLGRCQGTTSAWTQKSIRLSKTDCFRLVRSRAPRTGANRFWYRERSGGADRDRTDDLRLAKPALSQLSYSPGETSGWWAWVDLNYRPPAYQADALTGLSYRPILSDRIQFDRATALLALGPRKTNVVRRRLRVNGRKLPRSNESPGEPGIHSFAAIRLAAGHLDRTRPGTSRAQGALETP